MKTGLYFLLVIIAGPLLAGEADVLDARIDCNDDRICSISVTVQHADKDWDHYANRWEVLDEKGKRLATRTLAHPHVGEQPFTRSLEDVEIPQGISTVTIRARDSRHKYGGAELELDVQD